MELPGEFQDGWLDWDRAASDSSFTERQPQSPGTDVSTIAQNTLLRQNVLSEAQRRTQAAETPFVAQYDQIDLQTAMNEDHGSIPGASTNTATQYDQLNIQNGINEVYTGLPLAKTPSGVRQPRLNPLAQLFAPTQQPHSPADKTASIAEESRDGTQSTADRAGTPVQVVSTSLVAEAPARTSTACVRCHRTRTKCDREAPCQPCVKSRVGSSCTPHVSLVGIRTRNVFEPCYTGRTRCPGGMPCQSCERGGYYARVAEVQGSTRTAGSPTATQDSI